MNWGFLSQLLLPSVCLSCSGFIESKLNAFLCVRCHREIDKSSVRERFINEHCFWVAAGSLKGPLREIIHAFKYRGKDYLADWLAQFCCQNWKIDSSEIDVIFPVPLSWRREFGRGYNQSLLLSRAIGQIMNRPVVSYGLKRSFFSSSQTKLNREQRKTNAHKSYRFYGDQNKIRDNKILLVDDVITTGATVEACARELLLAGAKNVIAAAIAHEDLSLS